jgi:hypothetical protein
LPERLGDGAAFAPIFSESLPKELSPLVGATFAVEPGLQANCDVKLDHWGVLAEFEPHFSDHRRWGGLDGEAPPEDQIAREIFGPAQVNGRDHLYAADITEATKHCQSARWGRGNTAVPTFKVEQVTLPPSTYSSLLRRLHKAPNYVELERGFRESGSEGSLAELVEDGVSVWSTRVGETTFLLTNFTYAGECDGFSGRLTNIWRMQGELPVELPSIFSDEFIPILALDINRDGQPEWVSEDQLVARDGGYWSTVLTVKPHDYDCPC